MVRRRWNLVIRSISRNAFKVIGRKKCIRTCETFTFVDEKCSFFGRGARCTATRKLFFAPRIYPSSVIFGKRPNFRNVYQFRFRWKTSYLVYVTQLPKKNRELCSKRQTAVIKTTIDKFINRTTSRSEHESKGSLTTSVNTPGKRASNFI